MEQFHLAKSSLQIFCPTPTQIDVLPPSPPLKEIDRTSLHKDFVYFKGCALEYLLAGKSISDLCDHNATVSKKYGKFDVSLLWNFVKLSYAAATTKPSSKPSNASGEQRNVISSQNIMMSLVPGGVAQVNSASWEDKNGNKDIETMSLNGTIADEMKNLDLKHPKSGEFKHSGGSSHSFPQSQPITEPYGDFVFGDTELTVNNMDCIKSLRNGFLYTGPHDLCKGWSLPSSTIMGHDLQPSRPHELTPDHTTQDLSMTLEPPTILKISNAPIIPQWEPHQVLADTLMLQTDMGDVQTSVSILIVLGERRDDLPIDDYVYENWLMSYIDLLHRHQLWNKAAEIANASWIRTVNEINEQSTGVHTNCGECGKSLIGKAGWFCFNCKTAESSKCSVCHLVVRGLYAWCQGCSHGGHLEHMQQWFMNHSKCPKCGHLCEYE